MTDFICLGVPKCGTTTLYQILNQHRDIVFPIAGKNACYYAENNGTYNKFEKRYWSSVKRNKRKKYGFVAENWYGIIDVKQFCNDFPSNIKVIFIIRNPIERCYSDYKYTYAYRGLMGIDEKEYYKYSHNKAFSKFIKRNIASNHPLITCGNYYKKISEFYKYLPSDQIKVIVLEETYDNEKAVYDDLMNFLEVKISQKIDYNVKANEGKRITKNRFYGFLYGTIRTQIIQNTLCWKLGLNEKNQYINKLFQHIFRCFEKCTVEDQDNSGIDNKTYEKLKRYYKEDVKKLGVLLGKDLETLWFKQ